MKPKLTLTHSPKRMKLAQSESWAVAIKERYGNSQDFLITFNPDIQEYCSENIERICTEGKVPTLVRLSRAYDNRTAEALLVTHLTDAVLNISEQSIDENEIKLIARTIRADENLRTLNIAMIMIFFKRLKSGHYKIYGAITPRKIMETMQVFYTEARELQKHYNDIAEKTQRERERAEYEKNAITFEEYAKIKGIDKNALKSFGL